LDGMYLPNPKNCNKGKGICILNPEGIPAQSPGLAAGHPGCCPQTHPTPTGLRHKYRKACGIRNLNFSNVATRRNCCCPDFRGLKPTATLNCRDATIRTA
jgi:hypothetical protein